jgi:hypothetical protein
MVKILNTNCEQMIINIDIEVVAPTRIRIVLEDNDNPNTILTNRFRDIETKDTILIRLPICGKTSKLTIYDENVGVGNGDNTFVVTDISKSHLKKRLDVVDLTNYKIASFVNFCEKFCFNAGWLETQEANSDVWYNSEDGQYRIQYVEAIVDEKGNDVGTPACIYEDGLIQVDERYFRTSTVPMRVAILCHEFAHIYLNTNPDDESEADIRGLSIYLSLGYPRVEAFEAWIDCFWEADTPENKIRYQIIEKFIEDFENKKWIFYGNY